MANKPGLGQWRLTVAEQQCSLCGACAQWCGPKALTLDQAVGGVALRFDTARCPGCGLCVEACPEKAVTLAKLNAGQADPAEGMAVAGPPANCVRCGAPSVPARMLGSLARWNEALGGGTPATPEATGPGNHGSPGGSTDLIDYATCMACRSDMMFFGGMHRA
ncbi:MAG: 4Fe-4S dicluster domain-containing protein [Betaproteobacteria bacterium]|nr:4Fe-4S dicluster domain-containing protein [Betaproteobacteria bacterium]